MLFSMYSALSFDIEKFRERLDLNRVSIFILATSSCFMVIGVGIVSAILVLYIYLLPMTNRSASVSSVSLFLVIGFINMMFACSSLIGSVIFSAP